MFVLPVSRLAPIDRVRCMLLAVMLIISWKCGFFGPSIGFGQAVTSCSSSTPGEQFSVQATAGSLDGHGTANARAINDDEQEKSDPSEWLQLFNGKDLTGWTPKIRGHQIGDNYANTFRVVDGLLTVSYDKYLPEDSLTMDEAKNPSWEKFGHLFYQDKFSNYILRAEYRFTGDQVANGPGWAFRNNGLMLHGQDPATMAVMQKFPVSIEVQLLGGTATGQRSTLNLCTPGTNVVMNGKLFTNHCTNSSSDTFRGDDWVTVEVEVRGNEIIRHKIGGKVVLEYTQPQYDQRDAEARQLIVNEQLMLSEGTISIQSESHPTQFRRIELKPLDVADGEVK